jgi:outer membrane PBP1 activator LpoA protein
LFIGLAGNTARLHYNPDMKLIIALVLAAGILSGCSTSSPWPAPLGSVQHATTVRHDKARQLFDQARQLGERVKEGELTRVQVADQLNLLRLRLVGHNPVDDATFNTYRYLAGQRDNGAIDSASAQSRMEMTLRDWQQRWPLLARHPADPAFTNFLLQLYDLPPMIAMSP